MENQLRSIVGEKKIENTQIAIVSGSFYTNIADLLLSSTLDGLKQHGVKDEEITLVHVPGALEIPLTVQKLAESTKYEAIIALGAVIRGETAHFEYVSSFASNACSQIGLDQDIPVINGILTVENMEQAIARADGSKKNKGLDFALAAIQMINITKQL